MRSVLFSLMCAACGTPTHNMSVDQELETAVDAYFDEAWDQGKGDGSRLLLGSVKYVDEFDDEAGTTIGECRYKYVGVDIRIMRGLLPSIERSTLYHELGHCVFGLGHTPTGIMAAYTRTSIPITDTRWEQLVEEYWDEVADWDSAYNYTHSFL